jgi:hypothetical protein
MYLKQFPVDGFIAKPDGQNWDGGARGGFRFEGKSGDKRFGLGGAWKDGVPTLLPGVKYGMDGIGSMRRAGGGFGGGLGGER